MHRPRVATLTAAAVLATAGVTGVAVAGPSAGSSGSQSCPGCATSAGSGTQAGPGVGSGSGAGSVRGGGPGGPAVESRGGPGGGRGNGGAGSGSSWGPGSGSGAGSGSGSGDHLSPPPAADGATITEEVEQQLLFLVEEEKLAGDVYELAATLYDDRVFGTIAASEDRHADAVRLLLDRYGLTDPTAGAAAGQFQDAGLADLYDQMAALVRSGRAEARQAGVTIEETDIADLQELLGAGLPADVDQVARSLLAGSQRHLAAFTGGGSQAGSGGTGRGRGQASASSTRWDA